MRTFTGQPPPALKRERPAATHTPDAHLLVCHGESDPLVPPTVVHEFQAEMAKAPLASCTLMSFSNVLHGFTTPSEGPPASGAIAFNMNAARRSWAAAVDLFSQAFDVPLTAPVPVELWSNRVVVPKF